MDTTSGHQTWPPYPEVLPVDGMLREMIHEGEGGSRRSLLVLRNGSCLAVGPGLVRYARDRAALDDPLGNGVRGVLEIPPALAPAWQPGQGFVQEMAGGAVLLHGGSVLLVKPFAIELYAAATDALHARDCRGAISLSA